MKKSILLLLLFGLLFGSCRTAWHVKSTPEVSGQRIDTLIFPDNKLNVMIAPYKKEIDKEMGVVIGRVKEEMVKEQPESTLGNFLADAQVAQYEVYTSEKADIGILNHGGMRIPGLGAGDMTLGRLYELMPFDNMLVGVKLDGASVQKLLDFAAAKGGWHLSKGLSMTIENGKAVNVTFNDAPLDVNKIYTVALSDYLANGGDGCEFLKNFPQTPTLKSLRDAYLDCIKKLTKEGKSIQAKKEGRVKKQ